MPRGRDGGPHRNAETISGGAVHRRPEHVSPAGSHVALVRTPEPLAAPHDVRKRSEWARTHGQNHEGSLENRVRRCAPDIDADQDDGETRQHAPYQQYTPTPD